VYLEYIFVTKGKQRAFACKRGVGNMYPIGYAALTAQHAYS